MYKKIFSVVFTLLLLFPSGRAAFAAEDNYSAVPSGTVIFAKDSVEFALTTPGEAASVSVFADNKLYGKAELTEAEGGKKYWRASVTVEKSGSCKIYFKAYSDKDKPLESFGAQNITVRHLLPETQRPIIMGSESVVLLGAPPENCGQRQSEYGFFLGTDMFNLSRKIKSNSIIRGRMNKLVTGLSPNTRYYFRPYVLTPSGYVKGLILSFTTPEERVWTAEDAIFESYDDRYQYIFGTDTKYYTKESPPFGFKGRTESSAHLVKVEVPIWRKSGSRRVAGKGTFKIHYKLENNIKAIFDEIYALDIKFPVMKLYTYEYRTINGPGLRGSTVLSHHSFGTAIDINKPYNLFYTRRDNRDMNNPYAIPPEVISIFEKYGWSWGGNFKEGFDTMHFQYLGLGLVED
ncbi:MAG: M15 family metallopeptidase [Christensenellales bacterium]